MRTFAIRTLAAFLAVLFAASPALAAGPNSTSVTYGPASATRPGIVTTGTQTFAGDKTLTGSTTLGTTSISALLVTGATTATSLTTTLVGTTDSGTNAIGVTNSRIGASTAVVTRPIYGWQNNGTTMLSFLPLNSGSNMAIVFASMTGAAPSFTSRSIGTKLVIKPTLGASDVDIGLGEMTSDTLWYSVPRATSSYHHRWYGGATVIADLNGAGVLSLGTNTTSYARFSQKLETNTPAASGGAALNTWSATSGECSFLDFNRSKSATVGTHTIVASGDAIGYIPFRASDGTNFREAARISVEADGTPGASDMPGRIILSTTADGASTATERMRIDNAGTVTTSGSRIHKLRVATTTPITVVQGSDEYVVSKLASPGAVAVNLPASPATGLTYIIKDGTGDAAANNITITPAAGNIDGAGTLVLSVNYARAVLVYNGTEWNRVD